MKRMSGSLLALVLGASTVAAPMAPAMAQEDEEARPEPPKADAAWLKWCLDTRGGSTLADAPCYLEYREALAAEQERIVGRIYQALARTGPAATDYARAADRLRAAQAGWKAQTDGDCEALDYVFGIGTAAGLAGEDCLINHYEARNAWLIDFEKTWLDR